MIRWTETQDCLRVEFDRAREARLAIILATATLFLAAICLLGGIDALTDVRRQQASWSWFGAMVLLGVLARFSVLHASRMGQRKAWVEVAIRGGLARWGHDMSGYIEEMIPVRKFRIRYHGIGRLTLEALLADESQRRVMGWWIAGDKRLIRRLVADMNSYLGTPEDPITAGTPGPDAPPGNA